MRHILIISTVLLTLSLGLTLGPVKAFGECSVIFGHNSDCTFVSENGTPLDGSIDFFPPNFFSARIGGETFFGPCACVPAGGGRVLPPSKAKKATTKALRQTKQVVCHDSFSDAIVSGRVVKKATKSGKKASFPRIGWAIDFNGLNSTIIEPYRFACEPA